MNEWYTRRGGRDATHQYLAEQYDQAHARTMQALESVEEGAWTKGVNYPGWDPMLSGHVTLEQLFHYPARHFESHALGIKSVLDLP